MLSYIGPPDADSVANLGTTGQIIFGAWILVVFAIAFWWLRRRK